MEEITKIVYAMPDYVSTILSVASSLLAMATVYFSTKYRNGQHKLSWYLFALFLPFLCMIVFFFKRKEMNGAGMKQCPVCHSNYPKEFVTCYKCNLQLPEYSEEKSKRNKTLAIVMAVLFALCFAFDSFCSVAVVLDTFSDFFSEETYEGVVERISFTDENGNKVYYDREGNAYNDPLEVALYTKDGTKYVYSNATDRYQNSDGKTVAYYNAYIGTDGYLVIDNEDSIYYYDQNKDDDTYEVGEIGEELYESSVLTPYYEAPYTDDDGNIYYPADVASWTKDGKLITSDDYGK